MSEFSYDTTYQPPAPVLDITLITLAMGISVELTGMIDTGADATIIPVQFLQQIGARRAFATGLRSQWGPDCFSVSGGCPDKFYHPASYLCCWR